MGGEVREFEFVEFVSGSEDEIGAPQRDTLGGNEEGEDEEEVGVGFGDGDEEEDEDGTISRGGGPSERAADGLL